MIFLLLIIEHDKIPFFLGTWQTYVIKDQSVWHKIDKGTPIEYAASITVNPLTALKMLEDFASLKAGSSISFQFIRLLLFVGLFLALSPE